MTFEQFLELLKVLGSLAVTAFMTRWGYEALKRVFRTELADGLRGKVDVVIYSAKVKELHDLRNADREEVVALRAEVRVLREHYEGRKA